MAMVAEGSRERNADIAALAPGVVFHSAYEVVRCIKAGGMGAVYEVLQKNTQRRRALKVMLPSLVSDPEMRNRFELEAKIAADIESEHIVETLDAGVDEATGMPFILMELLKGDELGRLLKERKRLPPDEVVALMHQAALALDRTHAAGIIHRDLKPENLFITHRDDGTPRLKILDFGVAKIVADGTVNANSTKSVGSPLYMAPEQITGEQIGPAVDRYALAHIAFTLLVGKPFWHRERKASEGLYPYLMQVMRGPKVSGSARAAEIGVSLPEAFDAWFTKATSVSPAERFESTASQVAALADTFDVAPPSVAAKHPTRTPLPSIVAGVEVLPSIPPVSQSGVPTLTELPQRKAPPAAAPEAARSMESDKPPPSTAEPSSAALTKSNEQPVSQSGQEPKRRRSAMPLVVVLLVVGVAAVSGAFVMWPGPLSSMISGSKGLQPQPEATSKTTAEAAPAASPSPASTPTDVVPAIASSAALEPAPSASAAAPLPSGSALWGRLPGAPSGSTSGSGTFKFPSTSSSKGTRKGTNPLDEY